MFYPFKPGKGHSLPTGGASTDQLATSIFKRALNVQRRCADFLGQKAAKLPLKRLKAALLVITLAGVCYCCYLIAGGFWGAPRAIAPALKTQVSARSRSEKQQAFQAYLDSLEKAFAKDSIRSSTQNP
jgi:hypothetical protein